MKQRTISAILLLAVLIFGIAFSSKLFALLMVVAAFLGFNEFFDIKYTGKAKELLVIRVLGIISMITIALNRTIYNVDISMTILLPLLLLSIPIIIYNDNKTYSINDALYVLGIVYFLGLSFGNIIYLRDTAILQCVYIFIIAFITDTYAYIGGRLIGKHKLTDISPNKTIEGSVVGTLFGVIIGSVYYAELIGGVSKVEIVLLSLFLAILSEVGDLMFSSIKRYFGKKDYSNLIPGHGGILDRFDSVIYVSLGLSLILSIF